MDLTAPAVYGSNGSGPFPTVSYDLRYSTSPILYDDSDATWNAATPVTGLAAPKTPGLAESFTVTGLTGGTTYYFAIKSANEAGASSGVSNSAPANASNLGDLALQVGVSGYGGGRDSYAPAVYPTTNYGTSEYMRITGYLTYGPTYPQRGYLRFDLSSIPSGVTITSARLSLYAYDLATHKGSAGVGSYAVHGLTRDWTEAGVTWTNAASGVAWTTLGGDYEPVADASAPNQGVVGVWYDFNVLNRIRSWQANPSSNYGWCVRALDENANIQDKFYTQDTANSALRPKLVVSDLVAPVPGDINGDGTVDVVDLLYFVDSFGSVCGTDRNYEPNCDFNSDGGIDVVDLLIFVQDYWPQ